MAQISEKIIENVPGKRKCSDRSIITEASTDLSVYYSDSIFSNIYTKNSIFSAFVSSGNH
jgi:hypothetical protein